MYSNHWVHPKQPVWIFKSPHFIKAVIKSVQNDIVMCTQQNGTAIQIHQQSIYQRSPLYTDASRNDLMELDIINEPEVLQALKLRIEKKQIYTYVENTLIVLNPYQLLPEKYNKETKKAFIEAILQKKQPMKNQQPHVYAITAFALGKLLTEKVNQAIVISGQSGAGKTQTSKQCLRFIAQYFHNINENAHNLEQQNEQSKVQQAILLSNPILEAFGNSRTIQNNNSSRFGKYLNIWINKQGHIHHAEIFNYLLEKSRLISRAAEQQNFHILYEYINGISLEDKLKYQMLNEKNQPYVFEDFNYMIMKQRQIKNRNCPTYQPHPEISFQSVRKSLDILPKKQSYDMVCRVLSSILHLGNLQPYDDEDADYCYVAPQKNFQTICKLLQIDKENFLSALTIYAAKIGGQDFIKSYSKKEVQELINSLSKTLYQKLFQWIINQLNSVAAGHVNVSKQNLICCGFLDIYGFQVLQTNSLQQLFINYTNQRLHQIYLKYIFKMQKKHFELEGLQNKFKDADFEDNVSIIDLIDFDKLSVFNLLDQWCQMASDQSSFITNVRYHHKKNEKFPPSNFNIPSNTFIIKHTPRDVDYIVYQFKQKNRDLLRQEIKQIIRKSSHPLIQQLFIEENHEQQTDLKSHKARKFLSSKFRKSLNDLVYNILENCQLHFIRCIKSNSQKQAFAFDEELVFRQVKYLGIIDTIKIKKNGYCIKVKYDDLDIRFSWLFRSNDKQSKNCWLQPSSRQNIKVLLSKFLPMFSQQEILYGTDRVFFKDYAYGVFVKKYTRYLQDLKDKAHKIISVFIRYRYLKKKKLKKQCILSIQRFIHGAVNADLTTKLLNNIKLVQEYIRKFLKFTAIKHKEKSIITVQSYIKRKLAFNTRVQKMKAVKMLERLYLTYKLNQEISKRIQSRRIIYQLVLPKVFAQVGLKKAEVIEKYIKSFKVQFSNKAKLAKANHNLNLIIKQVRFNTLQKYITSFSGFTTYKKYYNSLIKMQSWLRTYQVANKFKQLKKATVIIQRAWRDYYFRKKGATNLFRETYKFYDDKIKNQNQCIKNVLFFNNQEGSLDTIDVLIKDYLNKFKEKMSLIYFMIDINTFVDMDIIYPDNSWLLNYYLICKDSLMKDTPIQSVNVAETYTVAATTKKLYVWGMNEKYSTLDNMIAIRSRNIQSFYIQKEQLKIIQQDQKLQQLKQSNHTINRQFKLQAGKLYQQKHQKLILVKMPSQQDRISEISCGQAHTILRGSNRKIYTFGNGKKGQLGHNSQANQQNPRIIRFFQEKKTSHPIQVSAGFTCSLVLMSDFKLYWFGTNGTIHCVRIPKLFQMKNKSEFLSTSQFVPIRILSSWSRSLQTIGVTILCYNGQLKNNHALKNKVTNILVSKWHQKSIQSINPPYISSVSDYLQACHVKIPQKKISIEPESKRQLKQIQKKMKQYANQQPMDISFAQSFRGGFFK